MTTATAQINSVVSAGCLDHADVVLREETTGRTVRIRVDADSGRAVLSEMNGLPSSGAVAIDVMQAVVDALGSRITSVEVAGGSHEARGILFVGDDDRLRGIKGLPASACLVIAARLGLPVRLREDSAAPSPAASTHPELSGPIWDFLDKISLD